MGGLLEVPLFIAIAIAVSLVIGLTADACNNWRR